MILYYIQRGGIMNKTTQPIKSKKKINELLTYLRGQSERNYMLAKVQLNTARRISDIVKLKVSDFFDENMQIKKIITIEERKTNKNIMIAINNTLENALKSYVRNFKLLHSDYLFQSRKGLNRPITTTQVHRIFNEAGKALNINNFGTHSLRKSWGYFCYKETKNIGLIMNALNHSSEKISLKYIGITQNDIDEMYNKIKF